MALKLSMWTECGAPHCTRYWETFCQMTTPLLSFRILRFLARLKLLSIVTLSCLVLNRGMQNIPLEDEFAVSLTDLLRPQEFYFSLWIYCRVLLCPVKAWVMRISFYLLLVIIVFSCFLLLLPSMSLTLATCVAIIKEPALLRSSSSWRERRVTQAPFQRVYLANFF